MTAHRWTRALVVVVLALAAVLLPHRAQAATASIDVTSVTAGGADVVLDATGLTQAVSGDAVTATLGGDRLPLTVADTTTKAGTAPAGARSAVLLLDASGSMAGAPIAAAKGAAADFLRLVPADVRVGLTVFNDRVTVAVRPTLDRRAVRAAVAGVQARGGTRLYDGLVAAVGTLGRGGDRRVVLISDGADSESSRSLETAAAALSGRGVRLTAIGFGTDSGNNAALARLARAGGGTVTRAADAPALARAFRTSAQQYSARMVLHVDLPDSAAGRTQSLTLSVRTSRGTLTARTDLAVPAAVASTPTTRPGAAEVPGRAAEPATARVLLWAGLAGVGLGLALLIIVAGGGRGLGGRLRQAVGTYTSGPVTAQSPGTARSATVFGTSRAALGAVDAVHKATRDKPLEERLALRLDRAGSSFRPAEWLLAQAGVAVALGSVLLLLGGPVLALCAVVVVPVAAHVWLSVRFAKRQRAFIAQMPDSLQLVAGSLSAGYSLAQALDGLVQDGAEPLRGEVGRALAEARIGVPIEDALEHIADRIGSEDFRWVVMAIRTQRQVGGNLAEVLRTVSGTIRERAKLHRQVRALSAEGRLSAYILMALPFGIGGFELAFRRDYVRPLYTEPVGIAMLAAAALLLVVGWFWMSKLVKVEV